MPNSLLGLPTRVRGDFHYRHSNNPVADPQPGPFRSRGCYFAFWACFTSVRAWSTRDWYRPRLGGLLSSACWAWSSLAAAWLSSSCALPVAGGIVVVVG